MAVGIRNEDHNICHIITVSYVLLETNKDLSQNKTKLNGRFCGWPC